MSRRTGAGWAMRGTWKDARLALVVACAATACGGPTGPDPDPDPEPQVTDFEFLIGDWDVIDRYSGGGGMVVTTARARVGASLGGRALEESWVGTRNGEPFERRALIVPGDGLQAWIMARGDGAAGTLDVLEGVFVQSAITLLSRPGTRPDGGLSRERFESISDSAFTWFGDESDDGGVTWVEVWRQEYARSSTSGDPTPPAAASGCQAPEHRHFDFWEGRWSVGPSTNDLLPLLGGCVLEENWSSPSEQGTSYNMYDVRTQLWAQVWTDTNGLTLVTLGGLAGADMVLQGPGPGGSLSRIRWTPNANGTVRQHGEGSGDGGLTWVTSYDLTYTRR